MQLEKSINQIGKLVKFFPEIEHLSVVEEFDFSIKHLEEGKLVNTDFQDTMDLLKWLEEKWPNEFENFVKSL
jgi:hypothetical protein